MLFQNQYRTNTCGELRQNNIGSPVQVCGWVQTIRDHGGVLFADIRDQYGVVQAVFHDKALLKGVTNESVVSCLLYTSTADISPDAKLKINGQEVEYTRIGDESDTQSFWVETDLSMMPTTAGVSDYKIIEGANGAWTQNSDGTLTFRANGDFSKFTGVKVDGTLIDAKNYMAVSGSTVITLKADYLKTLSVGTHKLTVVYTDGECSTNFVAKQATSEQTKPTEGDVYKRQIICMVPMNLQSLISWF